MKTRLFSRKDGKTLVEHVQDAADWVKAMVAGLPAKIKALLPEAEDFVVAVERIAGALKEGHPVNEAVEMGLAIIPGENDEVFYEAAKKLLFELALRLRTHLEEIKDGVEYTDGGNPVLAYSSAKRETAVELVCLYNEGEPKPVEAAVAVEISVLTAV